MFGNTSIRTILQIFSISTFGCALMVGYGCSRPLLYPPSCNLSPVLTAMYPRQIDTLAGCPRDNVYVENGINKLTGDQQPDEIKEMFDLSKDGAQFNFVLFLNETAAAKWFVSEKDSAAERVPVFRQETADGCRAFIRYVEQPRADPEGGGRPMGYYISRVCFQVRNAVVEVQIRSDKPQTDKLTLAVNNLADLLGVALGISENKP